MPNPLSPFEARRIAVHAISDHRTVIRYVTGLSVKSTSATRIEEALRQLGREDLVRERRADAR